MAERALSGLDFVSGLGMPPADFVRLGQRLGMTHVSLAPHSLTQNPHGFPAWSLTDPAMVSGTRVAMDETGVKIGTCEGCFLTGECSAEKHEATLDIFAGLGAERLSLVVLDRDRDRGIAEAAKLAEMGRARGMRPAVEFVPGLPIPDLPSALDAIAQIDQGCGLALDSMHLFRSGGSAQDVAALDPDVIAQVQLADAPMHHGEMSYGHEAGHERLPPGEGELHLLDMIRAVPPEVPLSLELPMLSRAEAGEDADTRLKPAAAAMRELIARA